MPIFHLQSWPMECSQNRLRQMEGAQSLGATHCTLRARHPAIPPDSLNRLTATCPTLPSQRPASEDRGYDRRASSSGLSALTSIDGQSRRSSNVSVPAGDTPATVVGQNIKAETPTSGNRRVSRGRTSLGDPNMDEESLKLIRALQQEDLGLRRRGARG